MSKNLDDISAEDGAPVPATEIPPALTAGCFLYSDGSRQTFGSDGVTHYFEGGRNNEGVWFVGEEGYFHSFWPPSYQTSYELRWVVERAEVVGLRFTNLRTGSGFDGRYGWAGSRCVRVGEGCPDQVRSPEQRRRRWPRRHPPPGGPHPLLRSER